MGSSADIARPSARLWLTDKGLTAGQLRHQGERSIRQMAAAWSPGWCVRVGWFPLVASAGGDARLHPVIAVRQFNGLHDLGGVRARIRRGITESSPRTRSCVPPSQPCPGHPRPDAACHHDAATKRARPSPSRLPWSELYRRVFREDLLVCPRAPAACGSWLRSPTPPPPTPLRPRRSPHRAAHGRPRAPRPRSPSGAAPSTLPPTSTPYDPA